MGIIPASEEERYSFVDRVRGGIPLAFLAGLIGTLPAMYAVKEFMTRDATIAGFTLIVAICSPIAGFVSGFLRPPLDE